MQIYALYKNDEKNIKFDKISVCAKYFIEKNLKHLDEVHKLFKIYLTILLTLVTPERSLSCLRQVKNYLRSTQGQTRLSDLSVIYFAKTIELNLDKIINEFNIINNRRLVLE